MIGDPYGHGPDDPGDPAGGGLGCAIAAGLLAVVVLLVLALFGAYCLFRSASCQAASDAPGAERAQGAPVMRGPGANATGATLARLAPRSNPFPSSSIRA
jgi:hypothetical protein